MKKENSTKEMIYDGSSTFLGEDEAESLKQNKASLGGSEERGGGGRERREREAESEKAMVGKVGNWQGTNHCRCGGL